MKEGFQYEGYWWLPEEPEDRISGQLIFVPGEKITLVLRGAFGINSGRDNLFKPELIQPNLIMGIESGMGREITILECQQTSGATVIAGNELHTSTYIGKAIFVGAHFKADDQIKFSSISVRFSGSEIWANKNPIVIEAGDDFEGDIIRYQSPISPMADIDDTLIRISFLGPAKSYSNEQVTISYKTVVEITPKEGKYYSDYLETIRYLQNFFSLAMGAPVFPMEIFGQAQVNKEDTNSRDFFPPIEIYFIVPSWPKELKAYNRSEILFRLSEIETNFGNYIQNWLRKYKSIEPSINLYFSVLYNPQNFAEIRFLSLTQAIET